MANYPNEYTIFAFISDCDGVDIDELEERVEDLEINQAEVYI